MVKKAPPQSRGKTDPKADEKAKSLPRDSVRETVESIVIAFVLAFLFRTFEAEAFVIPTGSMAPTLMGRHKDLVCSNCRFPYRVSASDEEPRGGYEAKDVVSSVCPVCRYQMDFGPGGAEASWPHASYKGDRILVAKFPYQFCEPNRWDVAVFKYPHEAKENYIKRLVGLPDETLVICRGDIFTGPQDLTEEPRGGIAIAELQRAGALKIERKPPAKVEAMLQVVHDNNYRPPHIPLRWEPQEPQTADWHDVDDGAGFAYDGNAEGDAWIVYNHLLPRTKLWGFLKAHPNEAIDASQIPVQLITDFCAYNTNGSTPVHRDDSSVEDDSNEEFGKHWVGDLAVECRARVESSEGNLILALVEGGRIFQCRIDLASGMATFVVPDGSPPEDVQTAVRGAGTYRLRFANVDDQLLLWVNGKSVAFDGRYGPLGLIIPNEDDLAPVRLGANRAVVRFDDLRVLRDVYYIAKKGSKDEDDPSFRETRRPRGLDFFRDPSQWGELSNLLAVSFALADDEFLMLGDNSPKSSDSRFWPSHEYYVKRELLIGKAVYIYWPHPLAFPGLPDTWWFPFLPNFPRMGFVR
jgi:signal peptidase I